MTLYFHKAKTLSALWVFWRSHGWSSRVLGLDSNLNFSLGLVEDDSDLDSAWAFTLRVGLDHTYRTNLANLSGTLASSFSYGSDVGLDQTSYMKKVYWQRSSRIWMDPDATETGVAHWSKLKIKKQNTIKPTFSQAKYFCSRCWTTF